MKKILIAEDDQAIVDIIKIILEGEGYTTLIAKEEYAILQALTSEAPALLLLDIRLEGLDGGEVAKKLKSKNETKHIPIIIISANNETEKVAEDAGADDFLLKPFDIEDLLSMVKKYVD